MIDKKNVEEVQARIKNLIVQNPDKTLFIAIDGDSGAGKTSLAKSIEALQDSNIFHMDDFFLPPNKKTRERLSNPGGNVDYERFLEQVIKPLQMGKPFRYQVFSCKQGKLTDWIEVIPKQVNIIEGVYSMHPLYVQVYDYKIFMTIDDIMQEERIRVRNGEKMLERYQKEWIPLERTYFEAFRINLLSDYIIDNK